MNDTMTRQAHHFFSYLRKCGMRTLNSFYHVNCLRVRGNGTCFLYLNRVCLVDKFFPNGSLAASPLHPHPSLVPILFHTRWTVRITQPWRAPACTGRQTCQHLGGHYFSPRRQETTTPNSLPRSCSEDNWAPLVQVPLDSGVNSDTSRIRTPLKVVRRAPPLHDHASNLLVCYAPQSAINFKKKK